MNSLLKTLLTPRCLGLLFILLLVGALSSRTVLAILVNLTPVILAIGISVAILWAIVEYVVHRVGAKSAKDSVESRLDELERLKRREMVTPEEYAAKRQEILKDL